MIVKLLVNAFIKVAILILRCWGFLIFFYYKYLALVGYFCCQKEITLHDEEKN